MPEPLTARAIAEAEVYRMERPKFTTAEWDVIWPLVLRAMNCLQRAQVGLALGVGREEE